MKQDNKKEIVKIDWMKELQEWLVAVLIGALAGPVLFYFLKFVLEPYAWWVDFLIVTLFWRTYARKKTFHIPEAVREWIEVIVVAGILAFNIRVFVIQAYKIPSGSMIPTLLVKDHLFVSRFNYWAKLPHRGEIIVFRYPEDKKKDFIKRVIAVEKDTIEIKNKQVYINGKPIEEPYKYHEDPGIIPGNLSPRDNFGPYTVPVGHLFMMGDNRDRSLDSRFWGFLSGKELKGKALIIYWPFRRMKVIK